MSEAAIEIDVHENLAASSVNTTLTPNTNCVATPSGDSNDTTQLAFQWQGRITFWSPSVSAGSGPVILGEDVGNAVVTFKEGLTVTYISQEGTYTLVCDGQIKDGNSIYNLTGKFLGSFPSKTTS